MVHFILLGIHSPTNTRKRAAETERKRKTEERRYGGGRKAEERSRKYAEAV